MQELQLAFGLTGAMLLPLLALNRVPGAAPGFFAFTAMREVMRLVG